MTPKRPKQLKWIGAMLPDGRPAQHLESYGLPARDLSPEETDALDADQIALARKHPDLYRVVEQTADKPKKAVVKKAAPKQAATPAESRPDGAETVIGTDSGDEPTPAAEPATNGEEG